MTAEQAAACGAHGTGATEWSSSTHQRPDQHGTPTNPQSKEYKHLAAKCAYTVGSWAGSSNTKEAMLLKAGCHLALGATGVWWSASHGPFGYGAMPASDVTAKLTQAQQQEAIAVARFMYRDTQARLRAAGFTEKDRIALTRGSSGQTQASVAGFLEPWTTKAGGAGFGDNLHQKVPITHIVMAEGSALSAHALGGEYEMFVMPQATLKERAADIAAGKVSPGGPKEKIPAAPKVKVPTPVVTAAAAHVVTVQKAAEAAHEAAKLAGASNPPRPAWISKDGKLKVPKGYTPKGKHSLETVQKIVDMKNAGVKTKDVAAKLGIPYQTAYQFMNGYYFKTHLHGTAGGYSPKKGKKT